MILLYITAEQVFKPEFAEQVSKPDQLPRRSRDEIDQEDFHEAVELNALDSLVEMAPDVLEKDEIDTVAYFVQQHTSAWKGKGKGLYHMDDADWYGYDLYSMDDSWYNEWEKEKEGMKSKMLAKENRRAAFKQYQATTSVLVPLPKFTASAK